MTQFVPEHRDTDIIRRIELEGDTDVAIAARRGHELRGGGGGAGERAPTQVDDQVGRGEPFENRPERARMIAASEHGVGQTAIFGPQERWIQLVGGGRRGDGEKQRGGNPAPRAERARTVGRERRCVVGRIHDEFSCVGRKAERRGAPMCADNVVVDARVACLCPG